MAGLKMKALAATVLAVTVFGSLYPRERGQYYALWDSICKDKKWAEGELLFRNAVKEHPGETDFQNMLNECLRGQKKFDAAVVQIEPVYHDHPGSQWTRDNYMWSLVGLGWDLVDRKDRDRAYLVFQKAYGIDRENEWVLNAWGYILRESGKTDESIQVLEPSGVKFPQNRNIKSNLLYAYLNKAGECVKSEKKDEAVHYFQKASVIDSKDEWYLLNYGFFLREKGEFKESKALLEKGIALYPGNKYFASNHKYVLLNYGRAMAGKGDIDSAISISKKGVSLYPEFPWFYTDLSDYFLKKGDLVKSARYSVLSVRSVDADKIGKESGVNLEYVMVHRIKDILFRLGGARQFTAAYDIISGLDKYFPGKFYVYDMAGMMRFHEGEKKLGIEFSYKAFDAYMANQKDKFMEVLLAMPLKGTYLVGGNSSKDSITHAGLNRYCFDFIGSTKEGAIRTDPGPGYGSNEEYIGFGRPVYCVADGVVEGMAGDFADLKPAASYYMEEGNFVSIRDGTGKHYVYQHLKKGSLKVKAGREVKAGMEIAALGNSGMTTVPHLHLGVYRADWMVTVPIKFIQYSVIEKDGAAKQVLKGTPLHGEIVLFP